MSQILIVDDDELFCDSLSLIIEQTGHQVTAVTSLKEGLKKALSIPFDIVFLDVRIPDGSGLDELPRFRATPSSPEVVVMTAFGDPDEAERAIKGGAWDYIEKSSSIKMMALPLMRALQYREQRNAMRPSVFLKREGIIGSSPQIKACLDLVAQAANSEAGVLISGETGTGKECFALAIHKNSVRAHKNFVVVDCASLPETLVESLLFGHEKGAFTGAEKSQEGLIKQADGGTLFLDEVGELSQSVQKTFLCVLQEQRFRPLGSKQELHSNFRVIAATNRDLDEMVQSGRFRQDLLYRLHAFIIQLPPLRNRQKDIRELAMFYVARFCEQYHMGVKGFSPEFLDALAAYDWPGNVRQLINTLKRVLTLARNEPTLFPFHLPTRIRVHIARASVSKDHTVPAPLMETTMSGEPLPALREFREAMDCQYLRELMQSTGGDIEAACRLSGLSRSRL